MPKFNVGDTVEIIGAHDVCNPSRIFLSKKLLIGLITKIINIDTFRGNIIYTIENTPWVFLEEDLKLISSKSKISIF